MPTRAPGYQATSGFTSDATLRDGLSSTGYERSQAGTGEIAITAKLDLGASPAAVKYLKAFLKWNQSLSGVWQHSNDDVTYTTPSYSSPGTSLRGCVYAGSELTWTLAAPVTARYWRLSVKNIAGVGSVPGCASIQIGVMEIWVENSAGVEIGETGGGVVASSASMPQASQLAAISAIVTRSAARMSQASQLVGVPTTPVVGSSAGMRQGSRLLAFSRRIVPSSGRMPQASRLLAEATGGVQAAAGKMQQASGMTATSAAIQPSSARMSQGSQLAGLTAGAGLVATAQSLFDFVSFYPGCGDVWGHLDGRPYQAQAAFGKPIQLRAAKILRASSWGLVYDDRAPASEANVAAWNTDDEPESFAGQVAADDQGGYVTGLPAQRAPDTHRTEAQIGETPYPSTSRSVTNRKRYRAAFRGEGVETANFRALESADWHGWLHFGDLDRIRTYHVGTCVLAFTSAAYSNVDNWVRLRADGRRNSLLMLGLEGASAPYTYRVYRSLDGGASGSEEVSVTAKSAVIEVISEAGLAALFYGNNSDALHQRVSTDGGDSWEAAEQVFDENGAAITGTLLDCAYDSRRKALHLLVDNNGDVSIYRSEDFGASWMLCLS